MEQFDNILKREINSEFPISNWEKMSSKFGKSDLCNGSSAPCETFKYTEQRFIVYYRQLQYFFLNSEAMSLY